MHMNETDEMFHLVHRRLRDLDRRRKDICGGEALEGVLGTPNAELNHNQLIL